VGAIRRSRTRARTLSPALSRQGRGGKKRGQQIERGLQADFEGAQVVVVDALQRVGEIDI
jgi:hypothetical protein